MKYSVKPAIIMICLSLAVSSSLLFAQNDKRVDGENIKKIISVIASDRYMGRETGTDGGRMAEEFFAKQFQEMDLRPAGENNSYYYTYTMPFFKVEGDVSLTVDSRTFYYGRNEDFRVENYSDGGKASGEIIFTGYGIISADNKRNDFENLELKGKIVLIKRGCPSSDWLKWKESAIDSSKAAYCSGKGAAGMLLFDQTQSTQQSPSPAAGPQVSNSLSFVNQIKNFPIFIVDERVARFILQNSEMSYSNILRKMDTSAVSLKTGRTAKMSARVSFERERKARNILGLIPGTDPALRNEAVMIGGHLDHVGTELDGKVNKGADDNASGSTVTLGIAQAMVKNKFSPKRTVIFAAWSGEEEGLLGSTAWCKKPTWDLGKVVVYFNLDMVGLGDGKLNLPGIYYAADVWKIIKENTDSTCLNKVNPSRGGPGGSDHTPFLQKGVPAMFAITSGPHPDYHQPGDSPEKIRSDILQFVGDFIYRSVELIAQSNETFLDENRNSQIRFKLATVYNTYPVSCTSYKESLGGKDIDISFVNFTENTDLKNYDKNFIDVLAAADAAIKSNNTNKEYYLLQSPNEAGGLPYQNKIGIFGAANLAALNYNELYCRTLSKTGVKIGFVDPGLPALKDSVDKNKTLLNISEGGMAIILKELPQNELQNALSQIQKPAGILSSGLDLLTGDLIAKMKSKGDIFLYKFTSTTPINEILSTIESLKSKLGNDLIALAPSEFSDASYNTLKNIYISLDKKYPEEDFPNKIFSDNIRKFLVKALQENTPREARGRPF